ncbi:MAG: hypothetical protein U9R32_09180 [Bacteroidota bacterium]|nr:hypothetical protein [Bacteroidota bacterium]
MKKVLFYCFICISFFSCKTLKPIDFAISNTPHNLLPTLEIEVNMSNLLNRIYDGSIDSTAKIKYTTLTNSVIERYNGLEIEYRPEQRVYDILSLYNKQVKHNIIDTTGFPQGSVRLDLLYFNEKRDVSMAALNSWSLGIFNLFGVPFTSYKTKIETQVAIYDRDGFEIKKYRGTGEGFVYIAMYWGYGRDAYRKSALDAFKNSMKQIEKQIVNDNKELKLTINSIKSKRPMFIH